MPLIIIVFNFLIYDNFFFLLISSEEPPAPPESFDDIRVLLNGIPMSLSCNSTAAGRPIQWYKNNETITNSDDIKIADNGLNLTIMKTVEASLGNYTCKYANSSAILSTYQVICKYFMLRLKIEIFPDSKRI